MFYALRCPQWPLVFQTKEVLVIYSSRRSFCREHRLIDSVSAVVRTLNQSIVVKELSIYWSIYVPTLIYSLKLWVMTQGDKGDKSGGLCTWYGYCLHTSEESCYRRVLLGGDPGAKPGHMSGLYHVASLLRLVPPRPGPRTPWVWIQGSSWYRQANNRSMGVSVKLLQCLCIIWKRGQSRGRNRFSSNHASAQEVVFCEMMISLYSSSEGVASPQFNKF